MNKSDLVGRVSESIDGGRTSASRAVEAVIDAIQEAVSRGEKVAISGFGVFERVERAARIGRNPATGESVEVKASAVPKFRPGAEFKGYVSGARDLMTDAVSNAVGAVTPNRSTTAAPVNQGPATKAAAGKAPAKKATVKAAAKKSTATKSTAAKASAEKAVPAKATASKAAAPRVAKAPAKQAARKATARRSS